MTDDREDLARSLQRLDRETASGLVIRGAILPDPAAPEVRARLAELAAMPAPDELPRTPTPARAQRRAALRRARAAARRARRRGTRPADPPDEAA